MARSIKPRFCGETVGGQLTLAIIFLLREVDVGLGFSNIDTSSLIFGRKLANIHLRRSDLRIRLRQRNAMGLWVNTEQQITSLHLLILMYRNLDDLAAYLSADRNDVLMYIGIIGATLCRHGDTNSLIRQQ